MHAKTKVKFLRTTQQNWNRLALRPTISLGQRSEILHEVVSSILTAQRETKTMVSAKQPVLDYQQALFPGWFSKMKWALRVRPPVAKRIKSWLFDMKVAGSRPSATGELPHWEALC